MRSFNKNTWEQKRNDIQSLSGIQTFVESSVINLQFMFWRSPPTVPGSVVESNGIFQKWPNMLEISWKLFSRIMT